jgi:hypothetical protein
MPDWSRRAVVVASDRNWDYTFYMPLTCLFWQRYVGVEPLVLLVGSDEEWMDCPSARVALETTRELVRPQIVFLKSQPTLEDCTLAQAARLFAAAFVPQSTYLLTSDMDMWPLSRHALYRNGERPVHLFSADAYGRHQFPLCYVGMPAGLWREVLGISRTESVGSQIARIYFDKWGDLKGDRNKAWDWDEKWFTSKLHAWPGYPDRCQFINRPGSRAGLMSGRVDRANWVWNGPDEPGLIDAHLLRPGFGDRNWGLLRELVNAYLPGMERGAEVYRDAFVNALG